MRTKDGRSRQFGFVGFKETAEADKAIGHFNNTYINMTKITVAEAQSLGSSSGARPWSKYSEGSSAFDKKKKKEAEAGGEASGPKTDSKKAAAASSATKEDPNFSAFAEVMQPRSKSKFWSNDDMLAEVRST